jgi:hypothetical protein
MDVLKYNFSVSSPLFHKPILVLFHFSRNEKVLACPAGSLLERSIVVDYCILYSLYSAGREVEVAKLLDKEAGVARDIDFSIWQPISKGDR